MRQIQKDSTSISVELYIIDSTAGTPELGVVFNTAGIDLNYRRDGAVVTAITEIDLTSPALTDAWESGGFLEVANGRYRLDVPDAAFATGVSQVTIGGTVTGMVVLPITIELVDSLSAAAIANLEDQYDGTGLTGDTFPATQAQVGNIATGAGGLSALISAFAKVGAEPETNTFTSTQEGDLVYHIVEDDGGNTDFYYQATVSAGGKATAFNWKGYIQSNGDSASVWYWDWVSTTYKQIDTLSGSNGTTPVEEVFKVPVGATGTGADEGKVRLRFLSTTTTAIATDKLLCEFTQASQSAGYQDGKIWVNTASSNTNTRFFIDGVVDRTAGSWANAVTISGLTTDPADMTDFHILNGSTIALTGNSDNFSLFGDNWTLQLESRSVDGAYFQGAHVSGISTSAGEVHFEGCDVATASVQKAHFDFCSFDGTVTHTLAGDYNYHNCYSGVAGLNGPTFAKTAGQTITAQWRGWKGSMNLTGLEVGDTLTIGGDELGTIDLGSPAGAVVVEIRGIYKAITNIGSAAVNLDGAINAADVALILGDTEVIGAAGAGLTDVGLANGSIVAATFGVAAISAAAIASNAIEAGKIAASALNGKGDWNTVVPDAAGVAPTSGEIKTAIEAGGSSLAQILEDTGTTLPALIAAIDALDAAGVRAAIGMANADLDTQLDALAAGSATNLSSEGTNISSDNE